MITKTRFLTKSRIISLSLVCLVFITSCKQNEEKPDIVKDNAKIYDAYIKDPTNSQLQDFSYAGYHYGQEVVPTLSFNIFNVSALGILPNTEEDLLMKVQSLLDSIGELGGGVLYFPKGRYLFNLDTSKVDFLKMNYNNVVLRGEGPGRDGTIFLSGTNTVQLDEAPWISPFFIRTGYDIQGTKKMWGLNSKNSSNIKVRSGSKSDPGQDGTIYEANVLANFSASVSKGESIVQLDKSIDVKSGDILLLAMYNSTDDGDLVKELLYPLDGFEPYMKSAIAAGVERAPNYQFIAEVKNVLPNNRIEFMQPFRLNMPMKYSPVVAEAPMLTEIGIENLRIESGWDGHFCHHGCADSTPEEAKIMDYGWNAINFTRVAHGWIKDVVIENFGNPIYSQDSRNITIDNILIQGYDGHSGIKLYGHSEDNLIQNVTFKSHFSHLVGGEGNGYGNVFRAIEYDGDKETLLDFHGFSDRMFSPMGMNLFENLKGVGVIKGAGAAFNFPNAARGNVFWNIEADNVGKFKEILQNYKYFEQGKELRKDHYRSYPGSIIVGYHAIGDTLYVEGSTKDRDDEWIYVESINSGKVNPVSLYEAQLEKRLKDIE